ncbi:hypothetical protein SETIT_8G245000v2 [Setaria italica]|uniref:Uncharacterized protein n=1 Tax=Setaria italica TaxID=4555 RepID=A0A368SBB1_SETIT|nr:hypothetical protein SETIT_8G245000v2 [Setaria italica]
MVPTVSHLLALVSSTSSPWFPSHHLYAGFREKLMGDQALMKKELDNLKRLMGNQELKKDDVHKLKGTTGKPWKMAMCSLCFLLLAIVIGWFVMEHMNGEEAFRGLLLSP